MKKRTKACSIKAAVKKRVEERDGGCCIFCGVKGRGEAHVIPRSAGGLGVEQNLITACRPCHDALDNSLSRPVMLEIAKQYLKAFYPEWTPDAVIYKKGLKTKALSSWTNKNLVNNSDAYIENTAKLIETKHEGFYFIEEGGTNEKTQHTGQRDDPTDL